MSGARKPGQALAASRITSADVRRTPVTYRRATDVALEELPNQRSGAACRDEEPELFFPLGEGRAFQPQITEAKSVCAACPLLSACESFALAHRP
uniref:WhiB family transcriptional regulator n=1 Tax=Saccharothrix espanaensis TaxID=103731 RepID=UPI003F496208